MSMSSSSRMAASGADRSGSEKRKRMEEALEELDGDQKNMKKLTKHEERLDAHEERLGAMCTLLLDTNRIKGSEVKIQEQKNQIFACLQVFPTIQKRFEAIEAKMEVQEKILLAQDHTIDLLQMQVDFLRKTIREVQQREMQTNGSEEFSYTADHIPGMPIFNPFFPSSGSKIHGLPIVLGDALADPRDDKDCNDWQPDARMHGRLNISDEGSQIWSRLEIQGPHIAMSVIYWATTQIFSGLDI